MPPAKTSSSAPPDSSALLTRRGLIEATAPLASLQFPFRKGKLANPLSLRPGQRRLPSTKFPRIGRLRSVVVLTSWFAAKSMVHRPSRPTLAGFFWGRKVSGRDQQRRLPESDKICERRPDGLAGSAALAGFGLHSSAQARARARTRAPTSLYRTRTLR